MLWMLVSTTPISAAAAAAGITAAAIVYGLHHLRSRPRSKTVATLIFWREVSRRSDKRALFSFPPANFWTMLLLVAITTLLSLVLTTDRWKTVASKTPATVFVFDIGSSMGAPNTGNDSQLSWAIHQAKQDISESGNTPALITAGEQPLLLCKPGEPPALLRWRLNQLRTTAAASASALALNLAGSVVNDDTGVIDWYTNQTAIPPGVADLIVNRIRIVHAPSPAEAVAITGAAFETSENPFLVTIRIKVTGRTTGALTVEARHGDAVASKTVTPVDNQWTVEFGDVPADGQVIDVRLKNAPGSAAEHEVKLQLPRRTPLRFYFVGSIPEALRDALLASGSESFSPAGSIAVGNEDQPFPTGAIAFIKVVRGEDAAVAGKAMLPAHDEPLVDDLSLEAAVIHHGPAVAAKQKLLLAGESTVAGLSDQVCYISSGIIDDDAELPKRAAFPILIHRIAAQLAGWSAPPPVITTLRSANDPLWDNQPGDDRTTNVVYIPPAFSSSSQKIILPGFSPSWLSLPWSQVVLGIGLTLLALEGFLVGLKKII